MFLITRMYFIGFKQSIETKDKISKALMGEKNGMYGKTGEENPSSKLTWEIVNEIRILYQTGNTSLRKLAKKYEVSNITIENVIKYRTWKVEYKIENILDNI